MEMAGTSREIAVACRTDLRLPTPAARRRDSTWADTLRPARRRAVVPVRRSGPAGRSRSAPIRHSIQGLWAGWWVSANSPLAVDGRACR